MLGEVRAHFLHVFYDDSVPWSDFFGSDYTFLNRTLAEFYGVPGPFDDSFRLSVRRRSRRPDRQRGVHDR